MSYPNQQLIYVELAKKYYNPETNDTISAFGIFPINAASPSVAMNEAKLCLKLGMQTADPRILWQDERPDDPWDYEDFSFRVTGRIVEPENKAAYTHPHS